MVPPADPKPSSAGLISRYRFRHNLSQRFVFDAIDPNERAYLHQEIAAALEQLLDEDADPVALAQSRQHDAGGPPPPLRRAFPDATWRRPALRACSQAGLVNNLNDGLAWGLFPLYFANFGLSVGRIGILAALYPAVWGLGQLVTGALSDRIGRKWLITAGMWTQAAAIALIAATHGFWPWAAGAMLLGAGTAMVYPTLLAALGDAARAARHRSGERRARRRGDTP